MKYLMTWMGTTSGSHLGRDDGYPERKFRLIESLDDLVKSHNPKAEYYRLEPVDVAAAVQAAKDLGHNAQVTGAAPTRDSKSDDR